MFEIKKGFGALESELLDHTVETLGRPKVRDA